MTSKISSVLNKFFLRFVSVLIVTSLFSFVLFINGSAAEFLITQEQFNSIDPYVEFNCRNASRYYVRSAYSGFNGTGSFDLHRFDSFPGDGFTVGNYGVNTVKVMWQVPVNLEKGDVFSCSFNINFDLDPVTNFLPNAISFFYGSNGDEFEGFEWLDTWVENPDIFSIPRISTSQKNITVPSSLRKWFPDSYVNTSFSANEKATVKGSFSFSSTLAEDTDYIWMVMIMNPIIKNNGYWMQYTDHVVFDISNFRAMDGASAIRNDILYDINDSLGSIDESINDVNDSLQGSINETFDDSKIQEYQDKDMQIESMFTDALDGTSSFFNDLRGLNDSAFRGVKFFGSCLTELIGINIPFYRLVIVSLCIGFLTTLLGIGIMLGRSRSSNSNNSKKGKDG